MFPDPDSDQRRWLLKAVREATGEFFGVFSGLSESALRWRPAADEWCLKEVAAHVRDAELLYQRQIDVMSRQREPRLPYEPVDVLPSERDYVRPPLVRLLQEYADAREETFWLLRLLDADDWRRRGVHPYRGIVTVYDIARELHEHDLDHLYQARRLREALRQPS
jgi:hypothetical protein